MGHGRHLFVLLLVLALVSCCMVLLGEKHGAFHYAPPPGDPPSNIGAPPKNIGGDCRNMINAYRKWRSDLKLSPYKAATAEQQKCANESAKIDAEEYKATKKFYGSGIGKKCSEKAVFEMAPNGHAILEEGRQLYNKRLCNIRHLIVFVKMNI